MWVQERWTGGGPFPKRVFFHFCQIGGVRQREMNMIKPQKTDKCTLSSSQSTLKQMFQLNLEEDEKRAGYVGEVTQGADKRSSQPAKWSVC